MTVSLKHAFQSAKPDGADTSIVRPSDWNAEHVLTQATNKLLGRTSAGTGATEEITAGSGLTLGSGTLSADVTSVAGRTGAVTLGISDVASLQTSLDAKAPLASPTFTGTVTLPSGTSIGSVTSTELGYLSGVTSSIQTQISAKLSTSATTYVQQSGTTGAAYLPAGSTAQRPGTPAAGYIRYNSSTGKFEGYGSAWGNIGGGAAIGDTPPANPGAGDLWWNSADGRMYVYYTDANSSQWVDLSAGGAGQYLPLTGGAVTGNVSVTGETSTGSLKVNNVPILAGPAFSAYSAVSGQSVSGATPTKVTYGLEDFDTNNNFSSSRFAPTIAGYYQLNWSVSSNGSQQRIFASLYKNGAEYARSTDLAGTGPIGYSVSGSSLVYCNGSTDYLEVYVYLQSSATVGDNGRLTTYFNGSFVRAA